MSRVKRVLHGLGIHVARSEFMPLGGEFSADVKQLARAEEHSIKTIFDIGANVGQTARQFVSTFPESAIHAFEPAPATFEMLRRSVSGDANVSCHQLAFGEKSGLVDFYQYFESKMSGLSQIEDSTRSRAKPVDVIKVRCETIDAFCSERGIEVIDLLKIDTEGHDLQVIQGAGRMLQDGRIKFICSEFYSLLERPEASGGELMKFARFLEPFGHRLVCTYTEFVDVTPSGYLTVGNALFAVPGNAFRANGRTARVGSPYGSITFR